MNQRNRIFVVAILSLLAFSNANADEKKEAKHENVTPAEFEKLAKEPNTVIIDVRTPKEYAAGHIKDSVLIDYSAKDFEEKIKQLDKSKTYLVHCASGGRSAQACNKLDAFEFPKVVNLLGGIKAWEKAGKPVEK